MAVRTGGHQIVSVLVLGQIADFQSREKDLRSKVTTAFTYPAILLLLSAAVVVFLMTFFIPRFEGIFSDFGAALPALTRFIVETSQVIKEFGIFFLVAIGLGVYGIRRWLATNQGQDIWEKITLRIPVLGNLVARFALARFCRMLGTLISAGVPLVNALSVARESLGNRTMVGAVSTAIERVKRGDRLADSLGDCGALFSGSVLEVISVAEESGRLDKELVRLAAELEGDMDRELKMAVTLAEPVLLFVMAAFIGLIVIGMVLPIFSIQDLIK